MYGFDGNYNAIMWLALTGDPMALRKEDREKLGLRELANKNAPPSANKNTSPALEKDP